MESKSWGIYSFMMDNPKAWAIYGFIVFLLVLNVIREIYSEAKKPKPEANALDKRLLEIFKEQDEQRARDAEKNRIRSEARNRVFKKERRKQLISSSKKLLEREIPNSMNKTREWILVAESYYKSHTYDPFWSALEQAAISLDDLKRWLKSLEYDTRELNKFGGCSELATQVKRKFLEFRNLLNRLDGLMSKGHSNFPFASIYQQRATRNVLVAGFTSLDVAINTLGREIQSNFRAVFSALNEISYDVSSGLSEIKDREKRTTLALEKTQRAVDDMSKELAS